MVTVPNKLFVLLMVIALFIVMTPFAKDAAACGVDPFVGEICIFAFNFCPQGFAEAAGQLLPINQNQALFSLIGTLYGGDGRTTFALPDLRGRTPVHVGQGTGLSDDITLGEAGGAEQATLNVSQLPSHSHSATTDVNVEATLRGTTSVGSTDSPGGNVLASPHKTIYSPGPANVGMGASSIDSAATALTSIGDTGGNQPIAIRSPFLGVTFCIALQGIFPSRQ